MIWEGLKKVGIFFTFFPTIWREGEGPSPEWENSHFFSFFNPSLSLKYFIKNLDIITLPGNHQLEESDACLFNTVPYSILHYIYHI